MINVKVLFKVKTAPYTQILRLKGLQVECIFPKLSCTFMYYVEILRPRK